MTIKADITSVSTCVAEGITANGTAPVLALCRKLIAAGHDPAPTGGRIKKIDTAKNSVSAALHEAAGLLRCYNDRQRVEDWDGARSL
jgi:hypothetical protein